MIFVLFVFIHKQMIMADILIHIFGISNCSLDSREADIAAIDQFLNGDLVYFLIIMTIGVSEPIFIV